MPFQLTDEQLRNVAGELEIGMRAYIHKETGELVTFPDPDQFGSLDSDDWQDEQDKVEANSEDYIEIRPMDSRESYQIMEEFIEKCTPEPLRSRLFRAIDQPKPFQRFKHEIDQSGAYRQQWFDFRDQKMVEWVKQQTE